MEPGASSASRRSGSKHNILYSAGASVLAGGIVASPLMLFVGAGWLVGLKMTSHDGAVLRKVAPIVLAVWCAMLVLGAVLYLVGRACHSYAARRRPAIEDPSGADSSGAESNGADSSGEYPSGEDALEEREGERTAQHRGPRK